MTNYYEFRGQFLCNGEVLDAETAGTLIGHLFVALDRYESSERFRFVDVSAHSMKLGQPDGFAGVEWSDYGIEGILEDEVFRHALRWKQAFDAAERNRASDG